MRKRMVDRETYLSLIIHVLNGVIAGMCVSRYEFEDLCSVSNCHLPEAATIFSYKCLKCQKHIGINSIATQYYTGLMIKSLKPWFGIPIIAIDYFSLFNYEM